MGPDPARGAHLDRPLREQLRAWGWLPDRLTITDDELAALARRNFDRDPAEWGGGGLEFDLVLLLDVLAGGAVPVPDQRLLLELTSERTGLPALPTTDAAHAEAVQDALTRWRTPAH